MKKTILNNWSLKLLSVAIAILVWLTIVNYDNPNTTRVISGIPIDITGTETLSDNDMTYRVVGTQTASVRIRCPRRLAQQLKVADFRATADFSQMYSLTNHIPVVITCTNSRVLAEYMSQITQSLEVTIENVVSRQVDVTVTVTGTPSEGYQVGEVIASPSVVTLRAPESILDQVSSSGVTVRVDTLSQSTTLHGELELYNAGGNVIDTTGMDSLQISSTDITVGVQILQVKNISLSYTVNGQDAVAKGYRYSGGAISLDTVKVAGRRSDLADLKSISLPEGELDVTGASETVSRTFQLGDIELPEGVILADSPEAEVTVVMSIEKLETRTYELDLSRVTVENLDESLLIENEDAKLSVTVEGLGADLSALEASEISGIVDLSGMTEGVYSVTAEVSVPEGFSVVGTAAIRLQLTSRETAPQPSEPQGEKPETEWAEEQAGNGADRSETETGVSSGSPEADSRPAAIPAEQTESGAGVTAGAREPDTQPAATAEVPTSASRKPDATDSGEDLK